MTTRQKLGIAFGTLTALLALLGGIILGQMRTIRDGIQRQSEFSRPRAAAVREMETSVHGFELAIRSFLHMGDPVFREDATTAAARIERHLTDYTRFVAEGKQRGLAARFSEAWRAHQKFADSLMDAPNSRPSHEDMNALVEQHTALGKLLEDEMKPDAVAMLNRRLTETSSALTRAVALTLSLMVGGVLLALVTSMMAGRAVLGAEENLRETAHRLRLVSDGSPALISYIDAEYRYQKVNKPWTDWFTLSPEQVEGRPVHEVLKETAWKFVQPFMARALAGETVSFERQLQSRDGSLRWIETAYVPDRNDAGIIRGFVAHATDITARKEAEQALLLAHEELQASEARYRALFEAAPVGIAQGSVETIEFHSANARYCDIVGYSREELRTMNFKQFTHPDDLKTDLDNMGRLLAGDIRNYTMEKRYIRKDGSVVWGSLTVAALWEPGAKPSTYMAVVSDITARKRDELALKLAKEELEQRVADRTAELLTTNWKLSNEVSERKQAEVALRISEQRFRSIYENAPTGIAMTGMDEQFIHCNPAFTKITGYSREELCRMEFSRLIHPDDKPENMVLIHRLLKDEITSFGIENRYVRKSGDPVWVHKFISVLRDEHGRGTHIIALVTDITERKQAEAALRESEERLRFALETSHIGAWDMDLVSLDAHRSLEHDRTFGYAELLDVWNYEIFIEHVLPEDRATVNKKFQQAVASRGDWDFECRIRRADGELRWIWAVGRHVVDSSGAARRLAGIVQDITERKQAEETLKLSEQKARAIFDQTFEFIGLLDPQGNLLEGNRAAMSFAGVEPAQVVGKPFWNTPWWTHSAEQQERLKEAIRQVATGEREFARFETSHVGADGLLHFVDFSLKPVRNEAGHIVWLIPEGRDITERKQLLDDIEAASERERERLGHDLHDGLSQLLVGARLKTDSLVKKLAEQSPENVPRAEAIANLMTRAVEESNNLARGLDPVEEVPEGLMSALTQLADSTDRLFGKDCACEFPHPVALQDHRVATELFRIAQEAVNNAVKHGEAGTIRIRLADEHGQVILSVTNDGEPFPKRPKPTGMGLKTMNYRANRIGATLQINPGPDGGTIVRCVVTRTEIQAS